jgi:hypothetical protein
MRGVLPEYSEYSWIIIWPSIWFPNCVIFVMF